MLPVIDDIMRPSDFTAVTSLFYDLASMLLAKVQKLSECLFTKHLSDKKSMSVTASLSRVAK